MIRGSRRSLSILVFVCVLLVGVVLLANAQTILYVDVDATKANNGSSWENAFIDLQDALTAAVGGGYEIWVAEGTYKPTSGVDRYATFGLIDGVALYGGFDGTEADRADRDWSSHETILSGDIGTPGDSTDNSHHVVTGSYTAATAVLDGFTVCLGETGMYNFQGSPTVANCAFKDNSTEYNGGGMFNRDSSDPTITDCTFEGNSAGLWGGGMHNYISNPKVTDCTFSGNHADWSGGGMYNRESSPTVTGCIFSDNSTDESGGGMYNNRSSTAVTGCTFSGNHADLSGGGMSNLYSGPMVTGCTFEDNHAPSEGGGMYNRYSNPLVTDCTFLGNSSYAGGGMYNVVCSPTVIECTFSGNVATSWGGGMCNIIGSNPTVTECTFSGNVAQAGGGMYNNTSSPTMTDCTFVENSVHGVSSAGGGMCNMYGSSSTVIGCTFSGNLSDYYGGGMHNYTSDAMVVNCTFSGNEAGDHGGGMYNQSSSPTLTNCTLFGNVGTGIYNNNSSPTAKNTILTDNTPADCAGDDVVSGGYNLEGGTTCGCDEPTDQQNTDPQLGLLADNGGPTETHALLLGSPAIDAIPAPYNGLVPEDQRGFPRPYPAGGFADIGAVEMQLTYFLGDVNGDGAIDLLDVVLCAQIVAGLNATPGQRMTADMDRDGDVDMDDVAILSAHILATGGAP